MFNARVTKGIFALVGKVFRKKRLKTRKIRKTKKTGKKGKDAEKL